MTRHRIYVVPLRADVDVALAEAHWQVSHAALFAQTPRMLAYVQDRPTPIADHGVVCSQTWFADAEDERAAYTGSHYLGPVATDEARFVDRDAAWTAVVRTPVPTPGTVPPWRALVFGWSGDRPPAGAEVLDLDRPGPRGGPGRLLVVPGTAYDSLAAATAEPGDLHLVTRPVVVVGEEGVSPGP